jgi:4-amino-4-deoxy-L-arabinose transferase-like glycosyltransferase
MAPQSDRTVAGTVDRVRSWVGPRLPPLGVAVLGGVVVFVVATVLFPYHSVNHDEGVYLQQAELLLEGRFGMSPPVSEAVRPWFFLEDGEFLYPKYAPVPAAVFAVGKLLGGYRIALALTATGTLWLTYVLGTAAFDRRTGTVAAGLLLVTPTFLMTSSVFLPYAPTTLLNLTFAVAYVRATRREGRAAVGYALLAGTAIGLAFFGRPYTAVLFSVPFLGHAVWTIARTLRAREWTFLRSLLARQGATAAVGVAFVGVTLAYNARMTGDPLSFPFEEFAPTDGLGFGYHRILQHEVVYTPELAVRSNVHLLWETATRWVAIPPIGTVLFGLGVGRLVLGRLRGRSSSDSDATTVADGSGDTGGAADDSGADDPTAPAIGLPARHLRWILGGLVASIVVGNVYFWGNYNVLADLRDPTDGFIAGFGPLYHFDLLVPLAIFGAVGAVTVAGWVRRGLRARVDSPTRRRVALAVLLVGSVGVAGAAEWRALDDPVEGHAEYTDRYAQAYEPIEGTDFEDALVFVPSAYGRWLNHPLQSLRNDPARDGGLEGPVVYALDGDTGRDFEVLAAYENRTPYRYIYHGRWVPDPEETVVPTIQPLDVRSGESLTVRTEVSTPPRVSSGSVRLGVAGDGDLTVLSELGETVTVRWRLGPEGARLLGVETNGSTVPIEGEVLDVAEGEAALAVTFATVDGATVTYREELDVRVREDGVEAIWPAEQSVCQLVTDCGLRGTYLPETPGVHDGWVRLNSTIVDS